MKEEYDFSKNTRGKFYRPNVTLNLPVYLTPDALDYLAAKTRMKSVAINDMVNDLLHKNIVFDRGSEVTTSSPSASN